MPSASSSSGIRDNHYCGSVGDYLKPYILENSAMSMVFVFFTIFAYAVLKEWLNDLDGCTGG